MTPSSVVSAAPTTVTAFCRIGSVLRQRNRGWPEQGQGDVVVLLLEHDFQRHVELQRFRRLRAFDDVGHHARPFGELHHGDRVGWCKAGHLAVMDHVAPEDGLAGRLEHADLTRGADGTEWTRW